MRALCYLLCAILLAPFAALALTALVPPDLSGWVTHAVELRAGLWSLLSGLAAALLAAVIGAALAYQVCFHSFPLRRTLERALVLPLLFPTFALAAIYRDLLASSGTLARAGLLPPALSFDLETGPGFVFIMVIGMFPFAYLLGRLTFISHGRAFLELGQSLGLGFTRAFTRILLPLSLPALLLGAGLVFVETAGDQTTAALLSVNTGAVVIHELWFARGAAQLAAQLAVALLLLALILLGPLARWSASQHARYLVDVTAVEPAAPSDVDAWRRWGWARAALCLLPVLLGFVIPAASVGHHFAQTVDFIDLSTLFADCLSSLLLLAAVVLICLCFALLFSMTHHAAPGVVTNLAIRWLVVSYTVPATVLAVGGLIVAEQALFFDPRYGDLSSFAVLALTLSARFVCFLLVPLLLGLSLISGRVEETGRSLGLNRPLVFTRLLLPQLRGVILLGLLLLVMQVLRETAISEVLHPFSFQTLVGRARAYIDIDLLPESSAWLLATALLGLYPLLTIEGLLARRGSARS